MHQPIYSLAKAGTIRRPSLPRWSSPDSKKRHGWGQAPRQWGMVAQGLATCLTSLPQSSLSHCLFTLKPWHLFTTDVDKLALIHHIPLLLASTLLPALRTGRIRLTRAQRPKLLASAKASLTDPGPCPSQGLLTGHFSLRSPHLDPTLPSWTDLLPSHISYCSCTDTSGRWTVCLPPQTRELTLLAHRSLKLKALRSPTLKSAKGAERWKIMWMPSESPRHPGR